MRLPNLSPPVMRSFLLLAGPIRGGIRPLVCPPALHCTTGSDCPAACDICYNEICHSCGQIACQTSSDCPTGCSTCTGGSCSARDRTRRASEGSRRSDDQGFLATAGGYSLPRA